MKGTEKQIKWAEEIKTATLEAIDHLIIEGQEYKGNPKADALLSKLAGQREALETCEYAGDIIDCFRYIKATDGIKERCANFAAACKVFAANNPTQRKLLGKQ